MTLGELIEELEQHDGDKNIPNGFEYPHSYRGCYDELAFVPANNVSVKSMLDYARSALGQTFTGYSGGEFKMDKDTDVNLSKNGCFGEEIGPLLLELMLANPEEPT